VVIMVKYIFSFWGLSALAFIVGYLSIRRHLR
jgi:hypothetical protein